MTRLTLAVLFLTLSLGACSPNVSRPQMDTPPPPLVRGNCEYTWASHDLPELTKEFDTEIKALNPELTSRATAFGEDCIYEDGHSTFSAMETDFYVELTVADLTDFEPFGNWIAESMQVVDELPSGLILGPNDGFVEFTFTKSESDFLIVRVPITQYKETANGKTGEELFRMFHTKP